MTSRAKWVFALPLSAAVSSVLWDGLAAQGKAAVKCRGRVAADDILADPQPVRRQLRFANPHLQVAGKLRVGRGQPEELATYTLQQHLGHEEVVISRQV